MGSAIRCPNCGHHLATLDSPTPTVVQPVRVRDVATPILLRVAEAARLVSVSRSTSRKGEARDDGEPCQRRKVAIR